METNNQNRQRNGNFEPERKGNSFEKRDSSSSSKRSYNISGESNDRKNDRPFFKKRDDSQPNFGERRFTNSESRGYNRDNQGYGNNNRNYNRDSRDNRDYGNSGNRNYNRDGNRDGYQSQGNSSFGFKKRPFNNDEPRGEKLSFRKAGEASTPKFIETRFDENGRKVNFRPRKNSASYDPNAKYSKKKQIEFGKTNIDPDKPVRLNKFIANAGICSRREADEYIQAGVISVNGEIVTELGVKVLPTDKVMFHNEPVRSERKVYLLLNKPKDCVTTSEDTHARLTVLDLVKNACSQRIYPVGRLDRNTTGVLLLTNDGDLASKLTHPKFEKKKIYHVTLDRNLEREDFEKILSGIELEDFKIAADALDFVKEDSMKEVGIEIHSGQNRVVRRIFEKLGYKILRLDRVFFAGLTKKNLPRGKYRFLNDREINMLKMGAYE